MFHFSKASSIHNIPPTSEGLLPHIRQAFYNAYTTMHALEIHLTPETTEVLDLEEFGFEHHHAGNNLLQKTCVAF